VSGVISGVKGLARGGRLIRISWHGSRTIGTRQPCARRLHRGFDVEMGDGGERLSFIVVSVFDASQSITIEPKPRQAYVVRRANY
jgi:hypothetical protein